MRHGTEPLRRSSGSDEGSESSLERTKGGGRGSEDLHSHLQRKGRCKRKKQGPNSGNLESRIAWEQPFSCWRRKQSNKAAKDEKQPLQLTVVAYWAGQLQCWAACLP
ncbi:hypothetical protein SLA2020_381630 [Shorea laevis]|jgi:hypothetical protein